MSALALQGMFFLSGMGALVFEIVWFNQIGLVVGNGIWSAALVVASFMAGLALGNAGAPWLARRWRNLVRGYAAIEALAAVSGAAVVLALPFLPEFLGPLLSPFLGEAAALNFVRLCVAFCLMALPAAALGTTLPLLSRPLEHATGSYGVALGRLYGVNTLGALAGVLLAELVLIPALGLRGSGMFAAACNLGAAAIALWVASNPLFDTPAPAKDAGRLPRSAAAWRIVAAAFLAGALLLALEVIWFRLLLLFYSGTPLQFAIMLAVVLAGIGMGGLLAARWARLGWSPAAVARMAAAVAAGGVVAGYAATPAQWVFLATSAASDPMMVPALQSMVLMGPVSLASGVIFTALGDALRARMTDAAAATAKLTLANTVGALAGSLAAAFVLLPEWGLEACFFALAALYALLALLVPGAPAPRWRTFAPALGAVAALALFPFGRMAQDHYRSIEKHYGARLVAAREGVAETAFYLSHDFLGETAFHRLVTNSHSMSATSLGAQRYMRLFAYLPAALHPRIESALVICFGVGSTASAITDLPDVERIDVVDVSRDILELSDHAWPDARRHPLRDRRVRTHVEDGRFFLRASDRRYDLITGEPPPPKHARVVSLYTREYFELVRDRLNPGGLATYWLPVNQFMPTEALAVIRAFCDAFEDCSLWSGVGLEWILLGSRGGIAPVPQERMARLWQLESTGPQLRRIGIETPAQLVAQFMADAKTLRELTARSAALEDDFPRRLSSILPSGPVEPLYSTLLDANASRARLESGAWAGILPASLVAQSRQAFRQREMLDALHYPELRRPGTDTWSDLAEVMVRSDRVTWPRWLLGSDDRLAEIARRHPHADPKAIEHLAIDALVRRHRAQFSAEQFDAMSPRAQLVTVFQHCLSGESTRARALMASIPEQRRGREPYRSFLSWAAASCA